MSARSEVDTAVAEPRELNEEIADRMPYEQFDEVSLSALRRRQSYKWRAFPADVLPSFIAEMDFPLAPPVTDALVQAVARGDCGYAWPDDDLGDALSGFFGARFGWSIDPVDVSLVPDVMTGVTEILRSTFDPGAGVVINPPVYPPFFHRIREAGGQVVEVPLLHEDGGYELDLVAMERAFASGARAYLLCNPHNPTGRVFSRAELEGVVELAERYGVLVLADEIHAPLALPGAHHTPFLSLGPMAAAHAIALVSASKGWNIPGLKCAQIIAASEPMRALVQRLPAEMSFRTGNLGVIASIAAYRDGGAWLDVVLGVLDRNRHLLAHLLATQLPQVRYTPPQGSYLAWVDCQALHLEEEPVDVFLERGRVALGRGPNFGAAGAGHVRVTLATSQALLYDTVARMRAALA